MKVLFVNPPNIRSSTSKAENDFTIKEFIVPNFLSKLKWSEKLFDGLDYVFGLSLGNRVLRADTAAIYTLTLLRNKKN